MFPGTGSTKIAASVLRCLLRNRIVSFYDTNHIEASQFQRFLILDRDKKFTAAFRELSDDAGTRVIRLPYRSPNLNAHVERFVLSIKSECLDRMIFFGEQSLRRAVAEFVRHYHGERNHQGLGNGLIEPKESIGDRQGPVQVRQRLGGMLNYYYREAA